MDVRSESALRRTEGYVHRNIAGEALLIPVRAQVADLQAAYLLNGTAEFIYLNLDGRRKPAELAGLLAGAYGVDPEEAGRDVGDLLQTLRDIGAAESAPLP